VQYIAGKAIENELLLNGNTNSNFVVQLYMDAMFQSNV
jgi:hypothetical protein